MKQILEHLSAACSRLVVVGLLVTTLAIPFFAARATWSGDSAPDSWTADLKQSERLEVQGREVAYWGDPEARYSRYATRKKRSPIAIVVHHTTARPVRALVDYGHVTDPGRGGASFGYHFYIGRKGSIVQGAPLSRRTNHIKYKTNPRRTGVARHLWSGNTIGVSLVGACDALMRPRWSALRNCSDEFVTKAQLKAGLAVIEALQAHFKIKCEEVYGHGDLQTDRLNFEGLTLSRLARDACSEDVADGSS